MYLTDLTFIEDGSSDLTKNGLINFQKKKLFSNVIKKIKSLQQQSYYLKVVPELYWELYNCDNAINDDDLLYNLSLTIEPRIV
jgi:son of sevenless